MNLLNEVLNSYRAIMQARNNLFFIGVTFTLHIIWCRPKIASCILSARFQTRILFPQKSEIIYCFSWLIRLDTESSWYCKFLIVFFTNYILNTLLKQPAMTYLLSFVTDTMFTHLDVLTISFVVLGFNPVNEHFLCHPGISNII